MPRIVPPAELLQMAGTSLGPSDWLTVDQQRIDRFADATEDHQFIHVDPKRAARTPFGSTIAHGFLSLSLLPKLSNEITVMPEGLNMAINYGLNKLRFLQPVKAGSAVRLRAEVTDVSEKKPGRLLVTQEVTVEIRDEAKPALVAESLTLYVVGRGEGRE
ncbi:MAG: MaoC family dehydratase [Acidobacteriota bacterium]